MDLTEEQVQTLANFTKKFIESQKQLDRDDAEALEEAVQAEFEQSDN